jgi:AraC-like DNA-binding protein
MIETNFAFSEIDSQGGFSNFGHSLGASTANNMIHIPAENGYGIIRKLDFEKGLHIRAWHFTLSKPFTFNRVHDQSAENGKAFTIAYVFSPDAIVVTSPSLPKHVRLTDAMSILLLSNNIDIDFHIQPGREIKALDITISGNWMKEQFTDAEPGFKSFIDKIKEGKQPSIFLDAGSPNEYRIASDLHEHSLASSKGMLYLKAKTLSLVSDFFSKMFSQHSSELLEGNVMHQEKMIMVEKVLEQHLEKDLPSIETIARNAALSESTLKRHFKLMFGKSIYEYYLEKKMEYAKRLLLEKPLTVKEVAYRLGYEKTSNFIHMFKKFHTYSPGHLKKNIIF